MGKLSGGIAASGFGVGRAKRLSGVFVLGLLLLAIGSASAQTVIDDGDAGFSTVGTWAGDAAGYGSDSLTHAAGTGTEYVEWSFTGLAAGYYQISATWPEDAGLNTGTASFQTTSSDGPSVKIVDQRVAPDDFTDSGTVWERLGLPSRVQTAGGTLTIRLSDNTALGRVVADAIRIEYLLNPEINVLDATGGNVDLTDGTSVVDLGQTTLGGAALNRTFAVRNYGATALSVGALTLPLGYVPTSAPAALVPAASGFGFGSTTFSVQLPSSVASPFIGQVSLVNGDADESPFVFTLNGDVTNVLPTSNIVDDGDAGYSDSGTSPSATAGFSGDQKELPSSGGSATWTFTGLTPNSLYRVSATWTTAAGATTAAPFSTYAASVAPANLLGSRLVDQSVAPNDFTVDGATWEDLGGAYRTDPSGTIVVQLTMPGTGFALADAVRIDPVTGPEIQVLHSSSVFVQDDSVYLSSLTDTVSFGTTMIGSPVSMVFTVKNFGTSSLTLGSIAFSGAHAADFSVTSPAGTPVGVGSTTTFEIQFNPSAPGLRSAELSFATNDTDENAFNFAIEGSAAAPSTPTATVTATSSATATSTVSATPSSSPSPSNTPSAASCPLTPSTTCGGSLKGKLSIKDAADDAKDKLGWKWSSGSGAMMQSSFGDPTTTGSFALCVYDSGALAIEAQVGPSNTLWAAKGATGYKYKESGGTADGITKVILKSGADGKAKAIVKGKGTGLPLPVPADATHLFTDPVNVVVQWHGGGGACWGNSFATAVKNEVDAFKAKF